MIFIFQTYYEGSNDDSGTFAINAPTIEQAYIALAYDYYEWESPKRYEEECAPVTMAQWMTEEMGELRVMCYLTIDTDQPAHIHFSDGTVPPGYADGTNIYTKNWSDVPAALQALYKAPSK